MVPKLHGSGRQTLLVRHCPSCRHRSGSCVPSSARSMRYGHCHASPAIKPRRQCSAHRCRTDCATHRPSFCLSQRISQAQQRATGFSPHNALLLVLSPTRGGGHLPGPHRSSDAPRRVIGTHAAHFRHHCAGDQPVRSGGALGLAGGLIALPLSNCACRMVHAR